MSSKITSTLSRPIPIILSFLNGQKNIYPNAINRADFNDSDRINEALEKIYKNTNYRFKNSKITTAILIQEE